MKNITLLALVLVAISIIFQFLLSYKRKNILSKLSEMIQCANFKDFYKFINKKTTSFILPQFDLHYLKLNAAMANIDLNEVRKELDVLDDSMLNKKQKELLYSLCFNYFVSIESKKEATVYFNKLISLDNVKNIEYYKLLFDTYVEDGYKYLEEAKEMYAKNESNEALSLLITKMEKNKKRN